GGAAWGGGEGAGGGGGGGRRLPPPRRDLAIVRPHAEAAGDRRIVLCGDVQRPERLVELTAFAVLRRVAQRAVGQEVAVGVGPRARGAVDRRVDAVGQRRPGGRLAGDVAAEVRARDGLAVAEEIEGRADARREIGPVGDVVDRIVLARRDERNRREVLRRHVGVVVVEADADVQRQPIDGPAIL